MILTDRQMQDVTNKSVWQTLAAHLHKVAERIEARRLAAQDLYPGKLDLAAQQAVREYEQYVCGYKAALLDVARYCPSFMEQIDLSLWLNQVRRLAELRGDPFVETYMHAALYVREQFPEFEHPLYDDAHVERYT